MSGGEVGELSGKVALVTGAGRKRGIGRATALALARAGADVVITGTGRPPESFPPDEKAVGWKDVESVAEEIRQLGRRALPLVVDVTSSDQVEGMVRRTLAELGRIDILVNNAAFARGPDRVPVVDLSEDIWRKVIDVDLTGMFLCCKAVAQALIQQRRGGRIVTISGGVGKRGKAREAAYCAAKFATIGLTQSLAWELGPHKINVNAVCPGTVDTSRMDDLGRGERWNQYVATNCALGRHGSPEEIAGLVLFLCSSAADFISGQSIGIDGGRIMS
ncbi:MAG: SDR family oxidoreductase [Chloroflexi bacterium]|nr:SDR family oxidoreductase [Chloroflexota bacterium]